MWTLLAMYVFGCIHFESNIAAFHLIHIVFGALVSI